MSASRDITTAAALRRVLQGFNATLSFDECDRSNLIDSLPMECFSTSTSAARLVSLTALGKLTFALACKDSLGSARSTTANEDGGADFLDAAARNYKWIPTTCKLDDGGRLDDVTRDNLAASWWSVALLDALMDARRSSRVVAAAHSDELVSLFDLHMNYVSALLKVDGTAAHFLVLVRPVPTDEKEEKEGTTTTTTAPTSVTTTLAGAIERRGKRLAMRCKTFVTSLKNGQSSCVHASLVLSQHLKSIFDEALTARAKSAASLISEDTIVSQRSTTLDWVKRGVDLMLRHSLHPSHVAMLWVEVVLSQSPTVDRPVQRRVPPIFDILTGILGECDDVAAMLVAQALCSRFLPTLEASSAWSKGRGATAPQCAGYILAVAAMTAQGVWSVVGAVELIAGTLAQFDRSEKTANAVGAFVAKALACADAASTQLILTDATKEAKALVAAKGGTTQVVGDKFFILHVPSSDVAWPAPAAVGATPPGHASSNATPPVVRPTPIWLIAALFHSGALEEGVFAATQEPLLTPWCALAAPQSATPWQSPVDALVQSCHHALDDIAAGLPLITEHAAALEECLARLDRITRLMAVCGEFAALHAPLMDRFARCLHRVAEVGLSSSSHGHTTEVPASLAANEPISPQQQLTHRIEKLIASFFSQWFMPNVKSLAASPSLFVGVDKVWTLLTPELQEQLVLAGTASGAATGQKAAVLRHPHATITSTKQKALLSYCLARLSADRVKLFARLLSPVLYGQPFGFVERLLRNSVAYSDVEILTANAQVLAEAPRFLFSVFTIVSLKKAREYAASAPIDGNNSESRITSILSLLVIAWRLYPSLIDGKIIVKALYEALDERSRASVLFASSLMRAIFAHLLARASESDPSDRQILGFSARPATRWLVAGAAEAMCARWSLSCTRQTVARGRKVLAASLSQLGPNILRRVAKIHSTIFDLYSDLPGRTDDVLLLTAADYDCLQDCIAALAEVIHGSEVEDEHLVSGAVGTSSIPEKELPLASLLEVSAPHLALAHCAERREWRQAVLTHAATARQQQPTTSAKADEEVPVSGEDDGTTPVAATTTATRVHDSLPFGLESHTVAISRAFDGHTKTIATQACLAALWALDLTDMDYSDEAYGAFAVEMNNRCILKDKQTATTTVERAAIAANALSGSAATSSTIGGGLSSSSSSRFSSRHRGPPPSSSAPKPVDPAKVARYLTYEDRLEKVASEKAQHQQDVAVGRAVLEQLFTPSPTSPATVIDIEPLVFVHAYVVPRARVSHRHARAVEALLAWVDRRAASLTTDKKNGAPLDDAAAAGDRLRHWISSIRGCILSVLSTMFLSFTEAELSRLALLCEWTLQSAASTAPPSLSTTGANLVDALHHQVARVEAFWTKTIHSLLTSEATLPAFVARNVMSWLDRVKNVFPAHPVALSVLATCAARFADPKHPLYASSTKLVHFYQNRVTAVQQSVGGLITPGIITFSNALVVNGILEGLLTAEAKFVRDNAEAVRRAKEQALRQAAEAEAAAAAAAAEEASLAEQRAAEEAAAANAATAEDGEEGAPAPGEQAVEQDTDAGESRRDEATPSSPAPAPEVAEGYGDAPQPADDSAATQDEAVVSQNITTDPPPPPQDSAVSADWGEDEDGAQASSRKRARSPE